MIKKMVLLGTKDVSKGRSHRKTTPLTNATPPMINQYSEISSSQVNFFKMLDEKIENGELEGEDSHESLLEDRHLRLQKVAEEWDLLLGRSQNSNDLDPNQTEDQLPKEEGNSEDDRLSLPQALEDNPGNSIDSMRTLFSNSVTLPAGTLREVMVQNNQESDMKL